MNEHQVSEAEIDEAVGRAFRRSPFGRVQASSVELFRRAGFCDEDAQKGGRLLESGRYMGFADVATSMGVFNAYEFSRRNPGVTPERIAEVARALDPGTATKVAETSGKVVCSCGCAEKKIRTREDGTVVHEG
jgi:hypothetical protein